MSSYFKNLVSRVLGRTSPGKQPEAFASMDLYIADLVARMEDRTPSEKYVKEFGFTEITHPISGEAIEEARRISNIELSGVLFSAIAGNQNNEFKNHLYFILGSLAINTKSLEATAFLVSRLTAEKDKDVLRQILIPLGELYKPAAMDLAPIIKCTESRNGFVRVKAYEALTNSEYKVEDFLVDKLTTAHNNDDIAGILHALMYVGTSRSIPLFREFLKSRHHALNTAAITGIAILLIRDLAPLEKVSQVSGYSIEGVQDLRDRIAEFTRRPLDPVKS